MPTFAAGPQLDRDRLELEREAWSAYRAALAGLTGREYEEAEADAWKTLQERLRR